MENKNKLLTSDVISMFGSGVSEVALLTLAFNITHSASCTSLLISIRLLGSLLVFFLTGYLMKYLNMKWICVFSDSIRAFIILLAIIVNDIYNIFIIAFFISFFSGLNIAVRSVAYQKFVGSDERIKFISKQQSLYSLLTLFSPFFAALLIKFVSLNQVFVVESICFLISTLTIFGVSEWRDEKDSKNNNQRLIGLKYLLKEPVQRNILFFRISILTSMISYQIISTYIITMDYSKMTSFVDLSFMISYSDVLAFFSFISALSLLFGNFIAGRFFSLEKIRLSFFLGAFFVSLGCIFWSYPYHDFQLLYYSIGSFILFLGLSFLRISLYASGQELTPPEYLAEIIAASDVISRSYQSLLGVVIMSLIPIISVNFILCFLAFSAMGSLLITGKISQKVQEKHNS
ncbi:MFS transporter [Xenorhabdus miraniensis]|uniref:MFS transporter n=1 Tax=Xenorhabdus miraniensis TaxID=351674 RepID=A0A2D0JPN3_9GAMM|nr:MFS transporter [Xenorhabdus miraniensis]PHM48125.1 hypothetical protein Xmir_02460 [Xenorhabdus miraniensis]